LVKVVGPIVEIQEQYTLPNDIDQHAFSKFTNIYFKVIYIIYITILLSYNIFAKNSIYNNILILVSVTCLGNEKRTHKNSIPPQK